MKHLFEKRDKALADAKAIVAKAKDEARELSTEERGLYQGMIDQVEAINEDIKLEQRAAQIEAGMVNVPLAEGTPAASSELEEFRSILKMEKRDISYAENVYAPKAFSSELIKSLDEAIFIRGAARRYTITRSEGITIPKRTAASGASTWGNSPTDDDTLAYGSVILKPQPLNSIVKLDKKIAKIAAFPIEQEIRSEMVRSMTRTLEAAYLTGDGDDGTPYGVYDTTAVPVGRDVTSETTTGFTVEDLIDMKNKLVTGYRNAVWILHPDVYSYIEKLKDGDDRYVVTPAFRVGEPDLLLGRPVILSDQAPNTFTAGSYLAVLGDFSMGYAICDVDQVEIQVLAELYAATNQVGYKGYLLTTGNVVDANAFVRLKTAASS